MNQLDRLLELIEIGEGCNPSSLVRPEHKKEYDDLYKELQGYLGED